MNTTKERNQMNTATLYAPEQNDATRAEYETIEAAARVAIAQPDCYEVISDPITHGAPYRLLATSIIATLPDAAHNAIVYTPYHEQHYTKWTTEATNYSDEQITAYAAAYRAAYRATYGEPQPDDNPYDDRREAAAHSTATAAGEAAAAAVAPAPADR